jgi:hypothetical protein
MITECELKNVLSEIEKMINLNDFNKTITYTSKEDKELFNKIEKLIPGMNKKESLKYCYHNDVSSISFAPKMCIIEFNKWAIQSFYQNLIKNIIHYLIKNHEIHISNVYLINNNNVLIDNKQTFLDCVKLFNNVPNLLGSIKHESHKSLDKYTELNTEYNISEAQFERKDYIYFTFINKIQIDFSYISYHRDEIKAEEELMRMELIIKELYDDLFNKIDPEHIITYKNFQIIGGM